MHRKGKPSSLSHLTPLHAAAFRREQLTANAAAADTRLPLSLFSGTFIQTHHKHFLVKAAVSLSRYVTVFELLQKNVTISAISRKAVCNHAERWQRQPQLLSPAFNYRCTKHLKHRADT